MEMAVVAETRPDGVDARTRSPSSHQPVQGLGRCTSGRVSRGSNMRSD